MYIVLKSDFGYSLQAYLTMHLYDGALVQSSGDRSLEEQRARLAPQVRKWRLFTADSRRFNTDKLHFLEDQAEDVKVKIRSLTSQVCGEGVMVHN